MGSRSLSTSQSFVGADYAAAAAKAPSTFAYCHNPYSNDNSKLPVEIAPTAAAYAPAHAPGILHTSLFGLVDFIPYPAETYPVHQTTTPREHLTRVFVGQLPYRVTEMQLSWLCDTIAPGAHLFGMETIVKKTGIKGKRLPTGCIHAFAHPEDVDYLIQALSFRVLFDDVGIWFAADDAQVEALQNYCTAMKHNEGMRFRDRPYQPVVVQFAVSHNGPRHHGSSTPPPAGVSTPPLTPHAAAYSPAAAWGYAPHHHHHGAAAYGSWSDAAY